MLTFFVFGSKWCARKTQMERQQINDFDEQLKQTLVTQMEKKYAMNMVSSIQTRG